MTICNLPPEKSPYFAGCIDYDGKLNIDNLHFSQNITSSTYNFNGNELNNKLLVKVDCTFNLYKNVQIGFVTRLFSDTGSITLQAIGGCVINGKCNGTLTGNIAVFLAHLGNGEWEAYGIQPSSFSCNTVNWATNRFSLYEFENNSNLGEDTQGSLNLTNVNGITQDTGKIGFSALADHTSLQYFQTSLPSSTFDINGSWSMSVWAKRSGGDSGAKSFISVYTNNNSEITLGEIISGHINLSMGTSFGTGPVVDLTIDLSQWHHYVIIKNGNVGTLHVDGVQAPYLSGRDEPVPTLLQDGTTVLRNFRGNTVYMSGNIDQFATWNKVLSQDEIDCLYNSGSGISI